MKMKAGDIMMQPAVAATTSTSVRDAAIQMMLGGFSGMPVASRDGLLLGVVTEFDVIKAVREGRLSESTRVDEIMSKDVISVDVDASVDEVIEILTTAHIVRVPVTEKGKLVGIIARPDILKVVVEPNFMEFS
jgi:CBS domain-containing protein